MPHPLHALVCLLALPALVCVGATVAQPAQAAPPPSAARYLSSNPPAAADAPYCHPEDLRPCGLGNDLIHRLDSVPPGGRIDVVLYSTTRDDLAAALVDAATRGVRVRMLTSRPKPDGESASVGNEMQDLVDRLEALDQPVKVGWGSLSRSGKAGIEHRKLVLIDPNDKLDGDETTISDSGNWTYALDTSYNDRLVVRDQCMYERTRKQLDTLWKDKTAPKIKALATCDGLRKLWMMPESKADPVLDWAEEASCGPGSRIDFANFYLVGSKAALVDRLIAFREAGADVRVAANDELTGHYSTSLKRRMVKAGITVYDASVLLDPLSGRKVYNHRKMLGATGCTGGAFGAQGSTTMNYTAYVKNGNAVLTTTVPNDVAVMRGGFDAMVLGKQLVTMADLQ